jgi:orotidine-5'-phosphate decarboxylase
MSRSFGARLQSIFADSGPLCVGIDPHGALLASWGLPDSATGVRDFGLLVVDAARGHVGIVKPQVSFFERHGSAGYAALEEVLAAARAAGLLVIADVKRGDVGTSVEAAADAWLTPGSPLEVDAMTAVAYQGLGSLDGVLERAQRHDKGVFVLAATSNPEAFETQTAIRADGLTVAAAVTAGVAARNLGASEASIGPIGVVVGATVALPHFGLSAASLTGMPILAPGFGHQGAQIAQLPELFGSAAQNVVVSVSRNILSAGPDGLGAAIDDHANQVAACLA